MTLIMLFIVVKWCQEGLSFETGSGYRINIECDLLHSESNYTQKHILPY
jgi:hypothetical protein